MNTVAIARLLITLSVLAVGLVGCNRASGSGATGKGTTEVRLGYFANLTHAQAVLGVSSGEFAEAVAPAKLTTRVFNAGPSLIEALFAGEIDIGYVGPGPVLSANERTRGQGIRVVAGAAANGVVIVARKGADIHSLKDLAGKRVATPQHGNTQDIAARHFLQEELKQADLTKVIPISNAEQPAMMARGDVDAAWVPEPWGARLIAENGAQLVAEEKDLWPDQRFALTVVVTTPEFLAEHPDVVRKMLGVSHAWTLRLAGDREKYVRQLEDALAELTGKRLPAGVTKAAIGRVEFTDEPLGETFQRMGQWSYDLGILRREPALDRLIDTGILRQELAAPTTAAPAIATTQAQ